jgi:hypothetical protein
MPAADETKLRSEVVCRVKDVKEALAWDPERNLDTTADEVVHNDLTA